MSQFEGAIIREQSVTFAVVVVRPPPDVSLYHRKSNPLFPRVLDHLGRREDVLHFDIPVD